MIEIKADLIGSILDIGGGGEAVIGQIYGDNVLAIDISQKELDEAPDCCQKQLMDARDLHFPDESCDNITFFYSLMYMTEKTQRKSILEAVRVLKSGGSICIWDSDIDSAYPNPFVVHLDICSGDSLIHTSYGIVKPGKQSSETILRFLKDAGISIASFQKEKGQFYIACKK